MKITTRKGKIMTEKERGKKIAQCVKDIILVDGEKFSFVAEDTTSGCKKNVDITLFDINGQKYILASKISKDFVTKDCKKYLIEEKVLKKSDFMQVQYTTANGGVFFTVLVNVDSAYKKAKALAELFDFDKDESYIASILKNAKKLTCTKKFKFTDEEIEVSNKAYGERLKLVAEKRNRANRIEIDTNGNEKRNKSDNEIVKDLVKKIEAYGWHVTLTLKDNE